MSAKGLLHTIGPDQLAYQIYLNIVTTNSVSLLDEGAEGSCVFDFATNSA